MRPEARSAVGVVEGAAQIQAYRLARDVAIGKILAALAATRDGLGTRDSPDLQPVPGADP